MAFEVPVLNHSLVAASDMSASTNQYILVKLSAGGTVLPCAAATDLPIGVLQNLPTQGKLAEIMLLGISKIRVGATDVVTPGFLLSTDSTGRAAAIVAGTATTSYIVGRVLATDTSAADNDGALLTAAVNFINIARGA